MEKYPLNVEDDSVASGGELMMPMFKAYDLLTIFVAIPCLIVLGIVALITKFYFLPSEYFSVLSAFMCTALMIVAMINIFIFAKNRVGDNQKISFIIFSLAQALGVVYCQFSFFRMVSRSLLCFIL